MAKRKEKKESIFWRIFITFIGVILIVWAINDVGLVLFGKTAHATVETSRTRGGSDPDQTVDKQYKWNVSWTFLVDGEEYSGSSTVNGSAISVKHGSTVYYYPFAPKINSLYAKDGVGFGTVILITIGVFLIVVMNKKPKAKTYKYKKNNQEISKQEESKQEIIEQEKATDNKSKSEDMKLNFCGSCGTKIIGKGKFCENCGAKIAE